MDKVVLDTNIIIDYLDAQREFHQDAADLLTTLFSEDLYQPAVLVSSIKDVYFILVRVYRNEAIVRERLRDFCAIIEPDALTYDLVKTAFKLQEPDVEDGIMQAYATHIGAQTIITRDTRAFKHAPQRVCTAREFLDEL